MKAVLSLLWIAVIFMGCSQAQSEEKTDKKSKVPTENYSSTVSNDVSFDVELEELFGDWVLIGVGADSMGPGSPPYGEIFFAFRDNWNMTVATEGVEELEDNLDEIPSPFEMDGNTICSDDVLFKMQFNESCVEIIRLNEGRMSIAIKLSDGGTMYKHFVKVE